jgi:hypothetical protein
LRLRSIIINFQLTVYTEVLKYSIVNSEYNNCDLTPCPLSTLANWSSSAHLVKNHSSTWFSMVLTLRYRKNKQNKKREILPFYYKVLILWQTSSAYLYWFFLKLYTCISMSYHMSYTIWYILCYMQTPTRNVPISLIRSGWKPRLLLPILRLTKSCRSIIAWAN